MWALLADSGHVADGSLVLAAPIALAAGLVSFLSPCVLPLVPGYLAYVTSLSGATAAITAPADAPAPRHVLVGVGGFVLGFTAVFVSFGALFGTLGVALRDHAAGLTRILGVVTIVLGLSFMGLLRAVPALARDVRIHRLPPAGVLGAPLLGGTFALGWTPCIGPTLATVLNLAASSENATAGRGAFLACCYCLGLGIPFMAVGLAVERSARSLQVLRRHTGTITRIGGGFLVTIGILQITGAWAWFVEWIQVRIDSTSLPL